jgi:hypothetical protein
VGVKKKILNGNLIDEIYMQQKGFLVKGKENILVCKLLNNLLMHGNARLMHIFYLRSLKGTTLIITYISRKLRETSL